MGRRGEGGRSENEFSLLGNGKKKHLFPVVYFQEIKANLKQ